MAENPDGMTLEQVGEVLGVTRERVRQIESAALEKLRTGIGLFEAVEVDVDGVTLAIALVECSRCGAWFAREGRIMICRECANPPKRIAPPAPPPRRVRQIRAENLELPEPAPSSVPPPLGGFLVVNLSWDE